MITPADVAAYIGAAAWLPQIGSWVHDYWAKPVISIVPARTAQVGFTRLGPIFNLGMALTSDRKSAIIESFDATLKHQDGESRSLAWAGMNETFSEITDPLGNRQIVARETSIAFKIAPDVLLEKFVRFQEPRFTEHTQEAINELVSHFTFLKNTSADFVDQALQSKELHKALEAQKNCFWWKAGRYNVSFSMGAAKPLKLEKYSYHFHLTTADIEALKQNFPTLDADLRNVINSNLPAHEPEPVNWTWRSVTLQKPA